MNFPDKLLYTPSHEWIQKIDEKTIRVGITDFAQRELGDIVYVDVPQLKSFQKDESFGSIEAIKTVADLLMPVSGTLKEINPHLVNQPDAVNQDPYGQGWITVIDVENVAELDTLLSATEYQKLVH